MFRFPAWLRGGCGFLLKNRPGDWSIEPVDRLFIPTRDQMPITVHRDLDRGVTKLFLHVDRAFSLLKEQAGIAVPQIVEPHLTQPSLFMVCLRCIRCDRRDRSSCQGALFHCPCSIEGGPDFIFGNAEDLGRA